MPAWPRSRPLGGPDADRPLRRCPRGRAARRPGRASRSRRAVERAGVDPASIDDVYLGCANQAGEDNRNVARMAALLAGLPDSVAGRDAQPALRVGPLGGRLRVPRDPRRRRGDRRRGRRRVDEPRAARPGASPTRRSRAGTRRSGTRRSAGASPTRASRRCSRSSRWARRVRTSPSARASRARIRTRSRSARSSAGRPRSEAGRFDDELVPVGEVSVDEHPRPDDDGRGARRAEAGVSSGRHGHGRQRERHQRRRRGARARERGEGATSSGIEPLGAFVGSAVAGVDPRVMGIGPIPAVRKLLARAGVDAGADSTSSS